MSSYISSRVSKIVANHRFWVVLAMFAAGTVLHYPQQILVTDTPSLFSFLGLTRHAVERILFLIPVTCAGLFFGIKAGMISLTVALAIMLPRVFLISEYPQDALLETVGIALTGTLVNLWFEGQKGEKEHRQQIIIRLEAAEQELRSSEEKYRYLFENASDAMWVHDMNGNFLDGNKAFDKLSGYTLKEWAGMNITQFLSDESLAVAREVRRKLLNGEELEQPYEQRFIRKSGAIRTVKMATSPFIIGGELRGFEHVARDVTEEKQLQEMLVRITNGSPVPTFVINKQHRITHWNTAIESLSGISGREIIGTDEQWRAFYTEKRPAMADLIVDGAAADEIETYYRGKYKKSRLIESAYEAEDFFPALGEYGKWLHFTASPIKNESGEIIAAIEILQDTTEGKQLQESMHFYVQLITKAQEEERRRVARELHDEVSPSLLLLIQRLDTIASSARPKLSGPLKENLEGLRSQAIEALEGLRHCAQDLRPRILDDLGLLAALEWMTDELVKDQGIDAHVETSGVEQTLPVETQLLLFRIAQEALSNIRRHAEASKVIVKVEFGDNNITITVSDNGKGFELPERIDGLASVGKLGLAGMQERARLLGGTLGIKSESDKGTQVVTEVPLQG